MNTPLEEKYHKIGTNNFISRRMDRKAVSHSVRPISHSVRPISHSVRPISHSVTPTNRKVRYVTIKQRCKYTMSVDIKNKTNNNSKRSV